jgi:catechol 2,3-dioxygenase-like lactoylglutathione lyase family enzyme
MSILSNSVHTGLFVENVEKMVLFYRDILGFETNWDGGPFVSFKVKDGGLFMFERKLFAEAMNQPYYPPQGPNLTMEIGIGVPTKEDVDNEYIRLMALGVHSVQEPKTQPWGQRNFWINDPEGNYIEVGTVLDNPAE